MEERRYFDLFDIEQRPGAGLALWTSAVERQLARVQDANYRHRLARTPNKEEQKDDPDAENELHADVYFLALAIRRILLFHDAFANQVQDPRLAQARAAFVDAAPEAKTLRDFYEHMDEYLLDSRRKRIKIEGRTAPVLLSRWDADDVVVAFGHLEVDVTLAGTAAIKLGNASIAIWDEHLDASKSGPTGDAPPEEDDGVPRMIEVDVGISTIIGADDHPPEVRTGRLLDVRVREATPEEIAAREKQGEDEG